MFYPLRVARAYNLMGQAELNIGWRNGSALAELAGNNFDLLGISYGVNGAGQAHLSTGQLNGRGVHPLTGERLLYFRRLLRRI